MHNTSRSGERKLSRLFLFYALAKCSVIFMFLFAVSSFFTHLPSAMLFLCFFSLFPLSLRTCQVQCYFYVSFRCFLFLYALAKCNVIFMLLFVCAKSNQKRTGGCRPYGYPALSRLPHSKLHALLLRQTRRRINRLILRFVL